MMKREALTVGYVARLFNVRKNTVKIWSEQFAEYLSKSANPSKGSPRIYTQSDLRVLAVINDCRDWNYEEDKDYSDVYYALNSDFQSDKRYLETAYLNSPIFQEVPDDIGQSEPTYQNVIIGGGARPARIEVARAYRRAGDILVDLVLENCGECSSLIPYDLVWPILFNYRHCIEVYLKMLANYTKQSHSIESLVNSLQEKYKPRKLNDWIKNLLYEWSEVDDTSTAFRFAETLGEEEWLVDFHHLKTVMGILCDIFDEIVLQDMRSAG